MFQMVCVNLIVLHEQNMNSKTDLLSKKKKSIPVGSACNCGRHRSVETT